MTQMKEHFKAPGKVQLRDKDTDNISDTQFKTLVIRMLQKLSGYFNSIKEDPSSNEVHIKRNKEKSTGNQE